jgi:hypothetical protein
LKSRLILRAGGAYQSNETCQCETEVIGRADHHLLRSVYGEENTMLKKFVAAMMVLTCVAVVSADTLIDVALVPVDLSGAAGYTDYSVPPGPWAAAGYRCFDLKVTVKTATDSWTTASADANISVNGTFWNHPNGGDKQPNVNNFPFFGLTRFDSFYCSAEEWPNPDLDTNADATSFAPGSPSASTTTHRAAEWYSDPLAPTAYGGTYTIARYTLLPTGTGVLRVTGNTYVASTGGNPHAYDVQVTFPEPGSMALLALGGLALIRRR